MFNWEEYASNFESVILQKASTWPTIEFHIILSVIDPHTKSWDLSSIHHVYFEDMYFQLHIICSVLSIISLLHV